MDKNAKKNHDKSYINFGTEQIETGPCRVSAKLTLIVNQNSTNGKKDLFLFIFGVIFLFHKNPYFDININSR